jgi:hypothetical protein
MILSTLFSNALHLLEIPDSRSGIGRKIEFHTHTSQLKEVSTRSTFLGKNPTETKLQRL